MKNKVDKLISMLLSEDLEVKKLACTYISNYNLDFTIYRDNYGGYSLEEKIKDSNVVRAKIEFLVLQQLIDIDPLIKWRLSKLLEIILKYNNDFE